jgi:hypothetical protein
MPIPAPVIQPGQEAFASNVQYVGNSETFQDPVVVASVEWDPYGTNFQASVEISATQELEFAPLIALVSCATAGVTVTLPDPGTFEGKTVTIQKMDATANAVTIATISGTIYGGSSTITTQYAARDYTAVNNTTYVGWVGR